MLIALSVALFCRAYRDKLFSYGAVSQDDTYEHFTGQKFEKPMDARYYFRVYVGGIKVGEYSTSEEFYLYKWEDRVQDSTRHPADITTIELYTKVNGLDSYQSHKRSFKWRIPTVIGYAENLSDAKALAESMSLETKIRIPASSVIDSDKFVEFTDLPVIVSVWACAVGFDGSVPCPDGGAVYPDGKIYLVKGKGIVEEYVMDAGYMFRNYTTPLGYAGVHYHMYNGTDFEEYTPKKVV